MRLSASLRNLALVAIMFLLAACTAGGGGGSASPTPTAASSPGRQLPSRPGDARCTWSARASAGALLSEGSLLLSFDPGTGRQLGACGGANPDSDGQPGLYDTDDTAPGGDGPLYTRPIVAGSDLRYIPNNKVPVSGQSIGGVRDLRSSVAHPLSFPDWLVVTTIGARLLLEHRDLGFDIQPESTSPAAWCVLPSYSAPRSQCAPIVHSGAGLPAVAPDGTIDWIPTHARPLTVGRLEGLTATDGSVVTQYVRGPLSSRDQTPVGTDEHTIVFLPGSTPNPARGDPLCWATVRAHGKALVATLHTTRITPARVGNRRTLATPDGGVQGSPDGHRLALFDRTNGAVFIISDTGTVQPVTLRVPRPYAYTLLRWPFPGAA